MSRPVFALCLLALSGCATTSFAPPSVNLENQMVTRGSNSSLGVRCMPNERLDSHGRPVTITRDVSGAQALIDNFVLMYRCRAHSAANGRQAFEVPALLIGASAATALALGAPGEVAISGGAATATLNGAKGYYSPREKAEMFDASLDALLCIKTESVGLDPITLGAISKAQTQGASGRALAGQGDITVSAEQRYFAAVSAALLSVERVLARRLSAAGTFDPAGVIAEIKALAAETAAKQAEAQATAQGQAQALIQDASQGAAVAVSAVQGTSQAKITQTIVQLETLTPRLQECVVRAKL